MINYEQAFKYLIYYLPKFGYADSGSNFYKNIGGSSVLVYVPRINSGNLEEFCARITDTLPGYIMNARSRAVAFVFIIPDEEGCLKRGSEGSNKLAATFDAVYRQGVVAEFDVVDLNDGDIVRIGGGGFIDRSIWKLALNLSNYSKDPGSFHQIDEEKISSGAKRNSTLRFFGGSNLIVIFALIGLNLLAFILGYVSKATAGYDVLFVYGVQYNDYIMSGQWWRLITAMFLHADLFHLLGNMLSLFYLGTVVSRFFSKAEVLLIYFISGLAGNVLSLFFLPDNIVSLGASGAVLGLGGVLIYMLVFSRNRKAFRSAGNFFSLAIMVVFNLVYGVIMTGSNINNFAHFGGFAAGFAAALVIERINAKRLSREDEVTPRGE